MTLTADSVQIALPVFIGVGVVVLMLLVDALGRTRVAVGLGALGMAASAAAATWVGSEFALQVAFGDSVLLGGWSSYVSAVLFGLTAVILAGDADHLSEHPRGGPVAALMVLTAIASAVLVATIDIVLLIIALETIAVAGYAFVAAGGTSKAREAAMKYVVQGAAVTGLLLYGAAVLYGQFGGAIRYTALVMPFNEAADTAFSPALFVLVAFGSAVAYKMSAFPFHSWAPDALETAPAGSAAMLSSVPKAAMLVAAAVLFGQLFANHRDTWSIMFAVMAVVSIAYGNLAALRQTSLQRMLAYSGIAQAGYALSGLAILGAEAFAVRLFALTYALGVAAAFMGARAVADAEPEWDGSIAGLAGLASRRPVMAGTMAVSLLSLTGIPLTAGFWGKFWVFFDVARNGWEWLAIVGFVGSVISFGYYGAVMRAMYLDASPESADDGEGATGGFLARSWGGSALRATIVLALVVLAVGLIPIFWGFESFITALV